MAKRVGSSPMMPIILKKRKSQIQLEANEKQSNKGRDKDDDITYDNDNDNDFSLKISDVFTLDNTNIKLLQERKFIASDGTVKDIPQVRTIDGTLHDSSSVHVVPGPSVELVQMSDGNSTSVNEVNFGSSNTNNNNNNNIIIPTFKVLLPPPAPLILGGQSNIQTEKTIAKGTPNKRSQCPTGKHTTACKCLPLRKTNRRSKVNAEAQTDFPELEADLPLQSLINIFYKEPVVGGYYAPQSDLNGGLVRDVKSTDQRENKQIQKVILLQPKCIESFESNQTLNVNEVPILTTKVNLESKLNSDSKPEINPMPIANQNLTLVSISKENQDQNEVEFIKESVAPKYFRLYDSKPFRNPRTVPKIDKCTRCTVIHSRKPNSVKRAKNFKMFSDTPVNRWTSVPPSMKEVYLKKLLKNPNNGNAQSKSASQPRDSELDTSQSSIVITTHKENDNESDIFSKGPSGYSGYYHSVDSTPDLVPLKNGNITLNSVVSDVTPIEISDVLMKPVTIVTKSKTTSTVSTSKGSSNSAKTVVKVEVGNNDSIESYSSFKKKKEESMMRDKQVITSDSNNDTGDKNVDSFAEILNVTSENEPVPKSLDSSIRRTRFDGTEGKKLGLVPSHELNNLDLMNCRMMYWLYDKGNGNYEPVIECIPYDTKKVPCKAAIKDVVAALRLSLRKYKNENAVLTRKFERSKKRIKHHYNQCRKMKNKVTSLEAELEMPNPCLKFLTPDQIESLDTDYHTHHWSDDTVKLAYGIRVACSTKGYLHLSGNLKYPLPSLKTLIRRSKELNLPNPNYLRTVLVKKTGEAYLKTHDPSLFLNKNIRKCAKSEENWITNDETLANKNDETLTNKNDETEVEEEIEPEVFEEGLQEPQDDSDLLNNSTAANNIDLASLFLENQSENVEKKGKKRVLTLKKKVVLNKKKKTDDEEEESTVNDLKLSDYFNTSQVAYFDSENNTFLINNSPQSIVSSKNILSSEIVQTSDGNTVAYKSFDDHFQKLLNTNASYIPFSNT